MAPLPTVGGDNNVWGTVLNNYLSVAHEADGTQKAENVTFAPVGTIAATDVQAAIEEVANEAGGVTNPLTFTLSGATALGDTSFTLSNAPQMGTNQGWFLIDPWTTSAELWRATSIAGSTVTFVTQSSESLTASNISFVAADSTINTTGQETISKFFPGEKILISGSGLNDGTYTVSDLPADGSYDGRYVTVVEPVLDEAAGASIVVRRLRRAHSDGAIVLFTEGPIPVTWYGATASANTGDASTNRAAIQRALDDAYYAQAYDIYLPGFMSGRYYTDAPIYVDKNTRLRGPNQKAAVIAAAPTFASWNDDVAIVQTRRNGLPTTTFQGGNDRYFLTSFGLDGGTTAYAKNTAYSAANDTNGTAYITSGTNTVAIHASLIVGVVTSLAGGRIVYRALASGTGGNSIRIAHVNDGANQPLTVTAAGNDITVHLATDGSSVVTSTAADVIAAVNADADSNGLVQASLQYNGYQQFDLAGNTLEAYNDGLALASTFALTALEAGTAPFVSGDVGRSMYLGMRYGVREITAFTNSSTVTVNGAAFTDTNAGIRFSVSPVNGLIGAFNQTAILEDLRIEACPGYGFYAAGCQEFSVRNMMLFDIGLHLRLRGVQFGHFIDMNFERGLDAYVSIEGDSSQELCRSNHIIGCHAEDIGPVDHFRFEGATVPGNLTIIDHQPTISRGSRIVRVESTLGQAPGYALIGCAMTGPNDGVQVVSDAKRGYSIPQTDFPTSSNTIPNLFVSDNGIDAPRPVVSKTSAYTMHVLDRLCKADAAGGAFSVALQSAAAVKGMEYTIKRMNSGANAVTVDPAGGETIDGAATVALGAQYDRITVISDGVNWMRID